MSYYFQYIQPTDNIGDSLSTVNLNYSGLNTWLTDIQGSFNDKWQIAYNFYQENIDTMNNVVTIVQANSAKWDAFRTLVTSNSAKWLQPITIIYPTILQAPLADDSHIRIIGGWLTDNWPIQDFENNLTNYAEGQIAIVNIYTYIKWDQLIETLQLEKGATCAAINGCVSVGCSSSISGTVPCNQGTYNLNYSTNCSAVGCSDCRYTDYPASGSTPPYEVTPLNTAQPFGVSRIKATVHSSYTDRYETEFPISLIFKVIDCNWTYTKSIVTPATSIFQ